MNKSSFFIVGQHAVIEALKNPKRKVLRVFLTEESKKNIHRKSPNKNLLNDVKVYFKTKKELDKYCKNEHILHQGFVAEVEKLNYPSLKDFIKKILEISDIKIITLAPEIDGMQEFINDLVELNIKIQFGHTLADFDCCEKIMKNYEIGFTHLYNAMSGNDHRSPGVLSAALSKGKYAEIICDNIHVSKEAIKIAKKCIPALYAITDSINASGLNDGEYIFAKNNIKKENYSVKIKSDGTLAGSIVTMDQTFKNLISMNFSLEEAVALTSYNASKYMKLDNVGIIQKNFLSNFLILDKEFNLKEVYLRGKKINV